jgi:hypothetical protein
VVEPVVPALLELDLELAQPEPAPPPAPRVSAPQLQSELVRAPERLEPEAPAAPQEPPSEPPRSRRRIPIVAIVGGVALVGVVAVVAVVSMGKREGTARPAAAAADTAPAAAPLAPSAPADTIAPSAPPLAAEVGYVRVRGDLPDDAIIWLDGRRMPARLFQASPGGHGLEVETGEFEPWETRITVRVGDTLRVYVELTLSTPSDSVR